MGNKRKDYMEEVTGKKNKARNKKKNDQMGSIHRLYSAHIITLEEAREMLVKLGLLDRA